MSYPPQPGYGAPGGYPPPGGYGPPPANRSNGLATAALVLGILSVLCLWPLGIVAVVLGFIGLSKAKQLQGTGKGAAIAGIITGFIGIIISIALLVLVVFAADKVDDPDFLCGNDETSSQGFPCENQGSDDPNGGDDGVNSDPADQICNVDRFSQDPDC